MGCPESSIARRAVDLGLTPQTIKHLGHSYGSEANTVLDFVAQDVSLASLLISDLPYIKAEVLYACRHEMAITPEDLLSRRTSIILEDRQRGCGVVDEVAAMMARELGWSPETQQRLVDEYRTEIQRQLAAEQQ